MRAGPRWRRSRGRGAPCPVGGVRRDTRGGSGALRRSGRHPPRDAPANVGGIEQQGVYGARLEIVEEQGAAVSNEDGAGAEADVHLRERAFHCGVWNVADPKAGQMGQGPDLRVGGANGDHETPLVVRNRRDDLLGRRIARGPGAMIASNRPSRRPCSREYQDVATTRGLAPRRRAKAFMASISNPATFRSASSPINGGFRNSSYE